MGKAKKRIIFHIGLGKTGSSSLQAFLSQNVEYLKSLGIDYPNPEHQVTDTTPCCGNIVHVMLARSAGAMGPAQPSKLARKYLAQIVEEAIAASDGRAILFSGEVMSSDWLNEDKVQWLTALNEKYNVTIAVFVRDVSEHLLSRWKQKLKGKGSQQTLQAYFDDLLSESRKFPPSRLLPLLESNLDVRVINYDFHKRHLPKTFLSEIVDDLGEFDFDKPIKGISNPSLTFSQANLGILAQQLVDDKTFSPLLIRRFFDDAHLTDFPRAKDPIINELESIVFSTYGNVIKKINEWLPVNEQLRTEPKAGIDLAAIQYHANDIEHLMSFIGEFLQLRPKANQEQFPGLPNLPKDFDRDVYLALNPDVAAANVDPVFHYINHGRFEGRRYI